MYTLRTFTEDSEVNNWLGNHYEVVMREQSYERFQNLFRNFFEKDHVADLDPTATEITQRCYAFVINEKEQPLPVYKGQKNYIVTVGGKTFSNITYK